MLDNCFEIAAFCLTGAILAVLIRQYCREQAMLMTLGVCCGVMIAFLTILKPALEKITQLFSEAGISDSFIAIIFKAMAICFITQIVCSICKDSGENAIASAAEFWGRGALVVLSLPMIEALVHLITN